MKIEDIYIVLIIAILVLSVMVILDWKYRSARRRIIRLISYTVLIVSVACLYVKPTVSTEARKIKAGILQVNDSEFEDSVKNIGFKIFKNLESLKESTNQIEEVLVYGHGLDSSQLNEIKVKYTFIPRELPVGIIHVHHSKAYQEEVFNIKGKVHVVENIKLVLTTPEKRVFEKSLTVENNNFEFTVTPKTSGNFLYTLTGLQEDDTLFNEKYPVTVSERPKPAILILTQTPSYEVNYLKNYLKKEGYGIATRQQLGRDLFFEEFVNLQSFNLNRIQDHLDNFNLIITDLNTWNSTTRNDKNLIKNSIREGKTGIMILDPNEASSEWGIYPVKNPGIFRLEGKNSQIELKMTNYAVTGKYVPINLGDKEIGRYITLGLGQVGTSLLRNSFELKLKGEEDLYQDIWKKILNNFTGFQVTGQFRDINSKIIRLGDFTEFLYYGNSSKVPKLNDIQIPVYEYPFRQNLFKIEFRAQQSGWNEIQIGENSFWFYVAERNRWNTYRMNQKIILNRAFSTMQSTSQDAPIKYIEEPIPLWIFYILTLLSLGVLWLEERL